MNRVVKYLITVIILAGLAPLSAQNPGDNVFLVTKVYTVNIEFTQPGFWDSLTYYYFQGQEQYMMGRVIIDGQVIDTTGVRLKGNSSFAHPNNKKSLRLAFGEYLDEQRWDGLKSIHLNNNWGDPTFLREKMYLDFCRNAGIDAPRSNYAMVYINGVLWCLYSLVEHVDNRFLSNHFDDNDGNLYKAADGIGATAQYVSDFLWYGSDSSNYNMRYELKTDEPVNPWTDLIRMIDTLNNSSDLSSSLPQVFDVQSYYRTLSADILFANLDSYINSGRNFYIYNLPADNRFRWIIWDAGLCFGGYSAGVTNYEALSITYLATPSQRPLVNRIYNNPQMKNDYLQTLCSVRRQYFSLSKLSPVIDSIAAIIRPSVYSDTRKMYTSQQFETNLFSDITVSGSFRLPGLKSFINQRESSVLSQLSALGISCEPVIAPDDIVINEFMASNDSIPDPAGEPEDWIEIYNNTANTLELAGMYLSDDISTPAKWQFPANTSIAPFGYLIIWADEDSGQTGLHANFKLSAGGEAVIISAGNLTVIDSVTFGAQTTNISMARVPNGTGSFIFSYPTPGAVNHNLMNIQPGEIVINEFSADNDIIPDPAGEAEDWIEIYNNSSGAINLSDIYLSDSFTNPVKWRFPAGTVIQPDSYLIVWADQDTGQAGLHALFALSASGERIVMSNADMSVIDSVSFGPQLINISMARIPNATGSFVPGIPTFNGPNPLSGADENAGEGIPAEFRLFHNYPNPFNPETTLSYSIPSAEYVTLTVYDMLGRIIAIPVSRWQPAGKYSLTFIAAGLPSGIYIYRLQAGTFSASGNMLLIK